mgnify:CR=1 FL=1
MTTIFMATVPSVPRKDSYEFADMRDYGMQVAAHVRNQYQDRIASLAILEALELLVERNCTIVGNDIVIKNSTHGQAFALLHQARAAIAKARGQ